MGRIWDKIKRKLTLSWAGITGVAVLLGGAIGIGGMALTFDLIDQHNAKISEGLPLLANGVHLREGKHNVVMTDQFNEMLHFETTEEDEYLVVNSLKEAYKTLNKYNSKLNFNLCTQDETISEKYDIPKVNSIGKQDIPLYITTDIIDNDKGVMAHTNWTYDPFTHEMKDLNITYRKDYLITVWREYETIEETLSAYNAAAYTMTVHESMHAMGIAHIDDHKSIMNTKLNSSTPKDVTEYDIYVMDRYNVQFYGAEPKYNYDYDNNVLAPITLSNGTTVEFTTNVYSNDETDYTM